MKGIRLLLVGLLCVSFLAHSGTVIGHVQLAGVSMTDALHHPETTDQRMSCVHGCAAFRDAASP